MAHWCYIYELDFGTWQSSTRLAMDNVRMDQKDDHVAYDLFGSNNMKDIAKHMGEVMKPGAQRHVFVLLYDLLCETKLFFPKKRAR